MRLPPPSAHYSQRARFGRYVTRRLKRARLASLAVDAEKVTASILALGRAWDDADGPVQDALADRDGFDDDLDLAAQDGRVKLAGRGADAERTAPYTLIFQKGLIYYTAAPLDEEDSRYNELKGLVSEHLPADDVVRVAMVTSIDTGLEGFGNATRDLTTARNAETLAASRLAVATDAWTRQMEKTFGALVTEVGKARAEKFFPKVSGKKAKKVAAGPSK